MSDPDSPSISSQSTEMKQPAPQMNAKEGSRKTHHTAESSVSQEAGRSREVNSEGEDGCCENLSKAYSQHERSTSSVLDSNGSSGDESANSKSSISQSSSTQSNTSSAWNERPTTPEQEEALSKILSPWRSNILGRLMVDFHSLLGQSIDCNTETADTSGNKSSAPSDSSSASREIRDLQSNEHSRVAKRSKDWANNREDEEASETEEKQPPKKSRTSEEMNSFLLKLACPYYKRNPEVHKTWKSCSGPGFVSVHRLKEHLYRRHALRMHCPRCWQLFKNDGEVDLHLRSKNICEIEETKTLEGFDKAQEACLKSRKRTNLSEVERWKDIYRILFPEDPSDSVPSPCKIFSDIPYLMSSTADVKSL
ncbi:hypothetical protein BT63DRAFT_112518 [Microthyrium microscopicum]|uniref:C2H2-type domain-containing protein n=1 Tax=Microthyrium microscopicum TaxID=703497 RepID=A0A6A6TWV1_9PEZI|nr:hypothetical protein BT63DRAFT_112518 [Microthyrium microscopicum]